MNLEYAIKNITYDRNWAIYVQKGEWELSTPALYGQIKFKNGGLPTEYEYFGDGEEIADFLEGWKDEDGELIPGWFGELVEFLTIDKIEFVDF